MMIARIKRFLVEEEAAAATEYAVMLSLLLLVIVATVLQLGLKTKSAFNNTATLL